VKSWRRKSYEVLPALSIRGSVLRSSLNRVLVSSVLCVVWISSVTGSHMRIFGRMLGFDDFAFGLLGAIPYLAQFGTLIAAVIIERTGLRKEQFIACATFHRLIWLVVAILPLVVPVPSGAAVALFLGLVAISWFANSLAGPAWITWMGDLIPRRIRGRFFAVRARLMTVMQVSAAVAIGVSLDLARRPAVPETPAEQPWLLRVTCAILALGALAGVVDILLFRKVREIVPTTPEKPRQPAISITARPPARRTVGGMLRFIGQYSHQAASQLLVDPLRDPSLRYFVLYGALLNFAAASADWFVWLFCLETLGFSNLATNTLFVVVLPLTGFLAARWWGRLADRWGRRPVLAVASSMVILALSLYFLASVKTPNPSWVVSAGNWLAGQVGSLFGRPEASLLTARTPVGAYLIILVAAGVAGVGAAGMTIAVLAAMLGFSDSPHGRSRYASAYVVLSAVGGVMGGLLGGQLAQATQFLQDRPITIGPLVWTNYHLNFALAIVVRVLSIAFLLRMPEPGAGSVRDLMRQIRVNVMQGLVGRLVYPFRLTKLAGVVRRRRPRGGP